jgi:hypothetical protein
MIQFRIEPNKFLKERIQAFCHEDYRRGNWEIPGTIENLIRTLKNDKSPFPSETDLQDAEQTLSSILLNDLLDIQKITGLSNLTVCVVPRAKVNYNKDQLLFKSTIHNTVNKLNDFSDGTDFIIRHTDTRTTHRNKAGFGGRGKMPYLGITKETCTISKEVRSKNILLVDDLYTKTVNVDEDAIQALLDSGAQSVIFYAVGKTVYNER